MNQAGRAALRIWRGVVLDEWIDYNGHMSEGFYGLVFGMASDEYLIRMGFGESYRAEVGGSFYTVETHITFLDEIAPATPLAVDTVVAGADRKRVHLFHELRRISASKGSGPNKGSDPNKTPGTHDTPGTTQKPGTHDTPGTTQKPDTHDTLDTHDTFDTSKSPCSTDETLAATQETMMLHVDTRLGRVAPMGDELYAVLRADADAHRGLLGEGVVGRAIRGVPT